MVSAVMEGSADMARQGNAAPGALHLESGAEADPWKRAMEPDLSPGVESFRASPEWATSR